MILSFLSYIVTILFFILSGCAADYPRLDMLYPLPQEMSCRVALLPFSYEGKVPRGGNIFYKSFATELNSSAGVNLVQDGDIQKLYQQMRLYRHELPNESQMKLVGNRLNAQLIILGEIIQMSEVDTGQEVHTEITVSVKIHEAATGKVLWSTYHKRKGEEYQDVMHFGKINTITRLSKIMANEIVQMWVVEGLNQCITH